MKNATFVILLSLESQKHSPADNEIEMEKNHSDNMKSCEIMFFVIRTKAKS